MGKGHSKRLRVKRALEASRGNLHKMARGKALPMAVPEAPKDNGLKLSASLRKMMALKAAVEAQGDGRKSQQAPAPNGGAADSEPGSRQPDGGEQPSTSGRQQQQQQQQQQGATTQHAKKVQGASMFQQFAVKKLKASKKEYLRQRELKKKDKRPGGAPVVERELQLRDKVAFGEVVHAPPKVHLKRKHWVDKEKTVGERCKEVFLKQMREAQQRLPPGLVDLGVVQPPQKRPKQQQVQQQAAEEQERLRSEVINAYRNAKKQRAENTGHATAASLAQLVKRGAGAARESTIR